MTKSESITEKAMVDIFMDSKRFTSSVLFPEVPVYSRCVDLVVYNQKKKLISAVEFKKTKWKAAIDQALKVSTCFDFIEICVLEPVRNSSKQKMIETCKQLGIGLYYLDPIRKSVKKVVLPTRIQNIWKKQKQDAIQYLDGRLKG